jgi:hypothetical protein
MRNLDGIAIEHDQAFSGERFQEGIDLRPVSVRMPNVKLSPGYRAAGEPAVAAGHGHTAQNPPGKSLLPSRECLVGTVSAGLDGVPDSASLAITMTG